LHGGLPEGRGAHARHPGASPEKPLEELTFDLLVLGSGGAGLMACLHALAAEPELRVGLAVKGLAGKSGCTRMVQGGFNAVLSPEDSLELHFADTIHGGAFLNDQELAWSMVSRAPQVINELETRAGCFFDRNPDGSIHQKAFAGQRFDRTVHRGDLTGIEIVSRLRDTLYGLPVTVLEEHRALDLLRGPGGEAAGAVLLDLRRGEFKVARAKAVVVGTGGAATMYRLATPSLEKSGDGVAMCIRAGLECVDMEMMQFHPTGIVAGRARLTGMILEEGLRGAGAHLRNGLGERYLERYDPERMERSTRDLVSRASFLEIQAGRGTPGSGVWLDASHLGADFVLKSFPGMCERMALLGKDLAREPVEVTPTAHFHMGGVRIDTACGTAIPGLFVAGEDAGGVHGANRLGGNGVAESTVFGAIAGETAAEWCRGLGLPEYDRDAAGLAEERATRFLRRGRSPFELRAILNDLMWERGGLIRDAPGLALAAHGLDELRGQLEEVGVEGGRVFNPGWQEAQDLENLLEVAQLIVASAQAREESRGSHYRSDFPDQHDARWLRRVVSSHGGAVRLEPIQLTRLQPDTLPREAGGVPAKPGRGGEGSGSFPREAGGGGPLSGTGAEGTL
jgi:succinate dehydrogenase / fumarate reductase flavoprotein subunit/fumarate reductase flavoprotein subunit